MFLSLFRNLQGRTKQKSCSIGLFTEPNWSPPPPTHPIYKLIRIIWQKFCLLIAGHWLWKFLAQAVDVREPWFRWQDSYPALLFTPWENVTSNLFKESKNSYTSHTEWDLWCLQRTRVSVFQAALEIGSTLKKKKLHLRSKFFPVRVEP